MFVSVSPKRSLVSRYPTVHGRLGEHVVPLSPLTFSMRTAAEGRADMYGISETTLLRNEAKFSYIFQTTGRKKETRNKS